MTMGSQALSKWTVSLSGNQCDVYRLKHSASVVNCRSSMMAEIDRRSAMMEESSLAGDGATS